MQITIAIKVPYHHILTFYRYGSEENNGENPDDRKCIADDTKQIADGTSGSRTARSRSKEDRRYAVPRGSQFCKFGLGIL
ncbi:hypothetical protein T4E_8875 [Trichinella pseudospiralis]|uniref:Uncharacterized protein n=1 Tax=Trichinella pseudospiralis TaxID=6337 RepID=A0A0V0XX46_TRIPS|nr:hypothetical protein T4E_6956 [Trichinella pseudospiralis]KRX93703.1 hypothetical protein T4E_8875 [Trichinella pseudospiralis]